MIRLRQYLSHPVTICLLRTALGLVFVVASIDKIESPHAFAQSIANYRLLPYKTIHLLAIVLPWVEVVAGTMLVLGVWVRANAIVLSSALVVFIIAISHSLLRHLDINCGCFSTDPAAHTMTRWTLYWDIIWLSWGAMVGMYDRDRYSLTAILEKRKHRR